MELSKKDRDAIKQQAIEEIAFARRYKQGKVANWQKNEAMYYGRKETVLDTRANVDLGLMQSFVHSLLSKIDDPLVFKYLKKKLSQLKRVKRLNALRENDSESGFWDLKDLVGKKQAIIYGRAIYFYFADSQKGYKSHLEPCDVYDFLIDPAAGGIDVELARYLGRYNVIIERSDLENGIKGPKSDRLYIKEEVDVLLEGQGNADESSQEETNKLARSLDTNISQTKKEKGGPDKFKFWEWFTIYEGERYKLLLQETGGCCIQIKKLTDLFSPTKDFPLAAWPVWTYAAFPDLTEFWSPAFCDYVREIFYAQKASVDASLDNAEAINKPQRIVDVTQIKNLAQLKYRRDGVIHAKGPVDANRVYQTIVTPSIETPIKLYQLLDGIIDKNSGVSAGDKGVSADTKVGIYEGNQANSADRFGLFNKSYAFGYHRFSQLYAIGVSDHLNKKVAVDILGPDGVETEMVGRSDIFRKDDSFGTKVESSSAENQQDTTDTKNKLTFLDNAGKNVAMAAVVNWKKAFEIGAKTVNFDTDDIKQLLDMSEFSNAEIISEASKDVEDLLDGKDVKKNYAANLAYKQYFVDFLRDHRNDITMPQLARITKYITELEPVIMENMVRDLNAKITAMQANNPTPPAPAGAPQPSNQPPPDGGGGPGLTISPSTPQNGTGPQPVPVPSIGA